MRMLRIRSELPPLPSQMTIMGQKCQLLSDWVRPAADIQRVSRNGGLQSGSDHYFGSSAEQNITADIAVFGRASWNDGASDTYAFTEIERSVSTGAVVKSKVWNRADDPVGVAFVHNGPFKARRRRAWHTYRRWSTQLPTGISRQSLL